MDKKDIYDFIKYVTNFWNKYCIIYNIINVNNI